MGAIAEALVAYAQPLLDQTDGSPEQMNKAFSLSSLCYNIGLLPAHLRDESISRLQETMGLDQADFEAFCNSLVYPMVERFDEMFAGMSGGMMGGGMMERFSPAASPPRGQAIQAAVEEKTKETEPLPYGPCPCNSGKKYKFCCKT